MKKYQVILLALLSGVLLSLPWLGFAAGWLLFCAFVPLLVVEDYVFRRRAQVPHFSFWSYSFLCFFVWNLFSCYWIGRAVPFGMIVIVTLNASLMSLVWWMFHRMKRTFNSKLGNLSLVAFWLAFEYLHFNWDMEWPWLTLGNGFTNQVKLIQWYEFTGVLGGSLWILIANLILFYSLKRAFKRSYSLLVLYMLFWGILVFAPIVWSNDYYWNYAESGREYELLVLQPNDDPYSEKFEDGRETDQIKKLLTLADSLATQNTVLVIAPETAVPSIVENDSLLGQYSIYAFHQLAKQNPNLNFIIGANTSKYYKVDEKPSQTARWDEATNRYFDIFNSALLVNESQVVQIYHKGKLVSGVEKMPFSSYFSFIERYIVDLGGATGSLGKQEHPIVFTSNSGLQIAPVICFESVFGQYISQDVNNGAELIVMLTNDGWWQGTVGYRQHLSIARIRAIETRRSIARAANTGVSAFINQRGDILSKTSYWTETAMKGTLKTNRRLTFYVRYGDYIGRISAFIAVLLLLYFFVHRKTKSAY